MLQKSQDWQKKVILFEVKREISKEMGTMVSSKLPALPSELAFGERAIELSSNGHSDSTEE